MKKKILTAALAMMVTITAFGNTSMTSEQNPTSTKSVATTTVPNSQKIIADLVGHQMYVSETVPGIWEFSSPTNIRRGNIGSTRLNGDKLEYNLTMILVDEKAPIEGVYKAEAIITYKLIDNSWQFQTVREVSFRTAGILEFLLSGDC